MSPSRHQLLPLGHGISEPLDLDVPDRPYVTEIFEKGYRIKEVRQVGRRGKRVSGFAVQVFDRMTDGRFVSLPRGELAAAIYGTLGDRVETILDDTVTGIEDLGGRVRVRFERRPSRTSTWWSARTASIRRCAGLSSVNRIALSTISA